MEWHLLSELDEESRREVLSGARRRVFARHEVVFHEGDLGDTLHLIESGRVAVRTTTPMGDTATLAVLGAGDAFGELALLQEDARRTATVIALERLETLSIDRGQFIAMCTRQPALHRMLAEVLAAQVRRLSDHLLEALYVPVDKRVARRLLVLLRIYGDRTDPVSIPLTQDDLAGLAGSSRPTVNQALQKLESRGAISLHRGRIDVIDRRILAQRAG